MSKILWLSWKDRQHPQAGGAEVVGHEIRKRLQAEGHQVLHLTSNWEKTSVTTIIDGIQTIRLKATPRTIAIKTALYYLKHLRGRYDIIIEEINTSPYFAAYYKKEEKVFLLYHQLTGNIWNYEVGFPLNIVGKYILEPVALRLNRVVKNVLAMSNSTKEDLKTHGFFNNIISVIPEATDLPGLKRGDTPKKSNQFTVLYLGSLRSMKRPEEVIKGFASAFKATNAKLIVAGGGSLERTANLKSITQSLGIEEQVEWKGRVDEQQKRKLLEEASVLCMTSVKEGWGLVAMEAGLFETPSVVYNVDGLRDAVINKKTGIVVTENTPEVLGQALKFLHDNPSKRVVLGKQAREFNEQFSFAKTYEIFKRAISLK